MEDKRETTNESGRDSTSNPFGEVIFNAECLKMPSNDVIPVRNRTFDPV
jgi:hypothetical protein